MKKPEPQRWPFPVSYPPHPWDAQETALKRPKKPRKSPIDPSAPPALP